MGKQLDYDLRKQLDYDLRSGTVVSRLDGKNLPDISNQESFHDKIPRSLKEVYLGALTICNMSRLIDTALYGLKNEKVAPEEATHHIKLAVDVIDKVLLHYRHLFSCVADEFVSDSLLKPGALYSLSMTEAVYSFGDEFFGHLGHRVGYNPFDFEAPPSNIADHISCNDLANVEGAFSFSKELHVDASNTGSNSFLGKQLWLELTRATRNRKLAGYAPPWDEFVKLDDPELVELEKRHPTSVTLRRDFYLSKRRGESYAELAKHWNDLNEKERKEICPRRFDEVTESSVKKQLGRLRDYLRDMRSDNEKNREF